MYNRNVRVVNERHGKKMSDIRNYMKKRMTVLENTEEEVEEYEQQLKAHKSKKTRIVVVLILIVVLVGLGYYLYQRYRSFDSYQVVTTIDMAEAYNSTFVEYNQGFVKYNADGIEYIVDGTTKWQQAFEMKNPIVDVCGEYVAIAEHRSNKVYVFGNDGLKGEVETSYPVISLDVASQGVVALITEEEKVNHIEVIDKSGKQIAIGQTVLSGDGCPVDISISSDGTKLVVSYLYLSDGVMQSRVAFYNYGEVGKNEVDRLVGGFNHYESTIIAKVEFINNDVAVAFGDDMITIFSAKQKPELVADIAVDKNIKSIAYADDYIAYIVETGEAVEAYELFVYNTEGKLQTNKKFSFDCTAMKMVQDVIVLYNNNELNIYTTKGVNKFKGTISEGIKEVLTTSDKYTYISISGEKMYKLQLD